MSTLGGGDEPRLLVCYGSSVGHTATVARRIRTVLEKGTTP